MHPTGSMIRRIIIMATISVSASIHAGDGTAGGRPAKSASTGSVKDAACVFTNFITRSGDKLMDGDKEFRFISVNCPILHFIEDRGGDLPDPFEQEDAIRSVAQMGGSVVRDYVLTVRKASDSPDLAAKRMISGPNTYNEKGFAALDKVLELCNRLGVRIIIPLTDLNQFFGGIPQLEQLRGTSGFFTNPQLRQDFKDIINYLLNRTNIYTGIKYKDDKAVLAWETGNELNGTDEWCRDIAAYIKSLDPNHLVMDGAWRGLRATSLTDPNIDIVSNHYYPALYQDFSSTCDADRNRAKGKKVFVVGEFGYTATSHMKNFLDTVIHNGTSGALLWALRPHKKDGGFHHHGETGVYADYHWPGFASGKAYDEIAVLDLIRNTAFKIRGMAAPSKTVPRAPFLLPAKTPHAIAWRGSTGAETYDIERADTANGPWAVVGAGVCDDADPFRPFRDLSAIQSQPYYYRAKAKNVAGVSSASNVIGPLTFTGLFDDMSDFSSMFQHTANLQFGGSNSEHFNGETTRLTRKTATPEHIVYRSPKENMTSFEMDSYFWPFEAVVDFKFFVSNDGATYRELEPQKKDSGGDWKRIQYLSSALPAGTRYLKMEFRNTSTNFWSPQIAGVSIDCSRDKK